MVADIKDVRSSVLPYSCQCLFLAYHRVYRNLESNTLPTASWVAFWFRTEDNTVPIHDPWTACRAAYGKGAATSRERTTIEQDDFDFLRVLLGKEDEVHLAALLSVWLSRFVFRSTGGDDLRPMVFKVASYMAAGVRFALAGPSLACLYRGLGHVAAGLSSIAQWSYLYSWLAVYFHTHEEDLEGARRPVRLELAPTVYAAEDSEEEEVYVSDRSHPHRRCRSKGKKSKGKKQVGAPSANKKRAPLTVLNEASTPVKKKPPRETPPASFPPSPPTFLPPILETEPHTEPQTSCPPEIDPPIETVHILLISVQKTLIYP
ncbi:hypothetical protein H6P81_003374 [Aristolochia fimbriata]|uniref:Aminotransferase-like plant mobile domain-containing protein n=1 Tax=Aristolochia fimbriata TaxID=158543 RepID=A0AAV7FG95_ARIFI|nr:hypothetical protein H6P81_003374 [Aristolochia fimbriata]